MVRFESVGVTYRPTGSRGAGIDVLRDISFELEDGSLHCVLGPSGAGKTTLLSLMNMARRPTRGEVIVLGVATGGIRHAIMPRLRRQIGVIFQRARLVDSLSVFDNVALPLRLGGRAEDQVRSDVMDILRWMDIALQFESLPAELSEGERQRLAIARAVIGKPRLLLADEPTTGLDPIHADRVVRLLRELNRLGSTVVVGTREEALAHRLAGSVMRLDNGRLVNGP